MPPRVSVSVSDEVMVRNWLDERVGAEVMLADEGSDSVRVAEGVVAVNVDVGVSVGMSGDVLETWRACRLAVWKRVSWIDGRVGK